MSCKICGKWYGHEKSLSLHMKVHEGLTVCVVCGKVSSKVADLRKHLKMVHKLPQEDIDQIVPKRMQRGLRSAKHICPLCGKTYSSRLSLDLHRKVHFGLTTCALCSKTCSRVSVLRKHLSTVHRLDEETILKMAPRNRKIVRR
ncbi:zinc finger protein 596-like [Pollicipes pollicipes]|uniref:zinc finger protein 596-like n=1 Tax=Pollicipes pollicipes TaxID=41117 RepID=UPI001884DD35|nr:zinc finger protein 596-like [Pollicipes pollicipes]